MAATAATPAPPSPAPPSPAPKGGPMSRCCKCLCHLLCPHHIDGVTDDGQAKDKYDDYQTFLSTVMTIGTLLLGFILTGTLLNYNYQGNNPRTWFAFPFDLASGLGAFFAAMSVMLSIWVSVRGSVIFRNNGPRKALRAMRNSTVGTAVAELSLYVSVYFFFGSVVMYISWAQAGPSEMCGHETAVKHCPMMETDLRGTLERLCADDADFGMQAQETHRDVLPDEFVRVVGDDVFHSCRHEGWEECAQVPIRMQAVQFINWEEDVKYRARIAALKKEWRVCDSYNHSSAKELRFHNMTGVASLVHRLASEFCRTDQLANIAEELCKAGKLADGAMKACASANTDAIAAAQCTDDIVDLAETCSNVCDSSYDFMRGLSTFMVPGTSALGFVMIIRAVKISQQVFANWQYNLATTKRPWLCCCHEVGILDTFSSEEEELPDTLGANGGGPRKQGGQEQQRDLKLDAPKQPVPPVIEGMSPPEDAKGASPRAPAVFAGLGWFFCGGSKRPDRDDSRAALCEDGQGTR